MPDNELWLVLFCSNCVPLVKREKNCHKVTVQKKKKEKISINCSHQGAFVQFCNYCSKSWDWGICLLLHPHMVAFFSHDDQKETSNVFIIHKARKKNSIWPNIVFVIWSQHFGETTRVLIKKFFFPFLSINLTCLSLFMMLVVHICSTFLHHNLPKACNQITFVQWVWTFTSRWKNF